jgi:hypothetical protein
MHQITRSHTAVYCMNNAFLCKTILSSLWLLIGGMINSSSSDTIINNRRRYRNDWWPDDMIRVRKSDSCNSSSSDTMVIDSPSIKKHRQLYDRNVLLAHLTSGQKCWLYLPACLLLRVLPIIIIYIISPAIRGDIFIFYDIHTQCKLPVWGVTCCMFLPQELEWHTDVCLDEMSADVCVHLCT